MTSFLTRIRDDEEGRVSEIAVPVVPSMRLIIEVHGDGGMVHEIIGVEARASLLEDLAVHLGAGVVYVRQ